MPGKRIGYFSCVESGGRYIGAMMITDGAGIPLEFKYTEPIKPTRIQAILYGGSLERYVKLEVIRAKLAKSLQNRPDVIFIDNTDLSLLGQCEGIPVVAVQRAHISPLAEAGATKQPRENELIVQPQEGVEPLRLIFASSDAELIGRVEALVVEAGRSMDAAEPLERVAQALDALLRERKEAGKASG